MRAASSPRPSPVRALLRGHTLKSGEPVVIEPRDFARHLYIAGMSGTGKSSLLANIALQHAASGDGLAFIDPHGDASQAILDRLPHTRR